MSTFFSFGRLCLYGFLLNGTQMAFVIDSIY